MTSDMVAAPETGLPGAAPTSAVPAGAGSGGGTEGMGGSHVDGGATGFGSMAGASSPFPSAEVVRAEGSTGVATRPIELLHGVEMAVTVELGRTRMTMRELLNLRVGSIVELDRPAGGPVDVVVNGTLLARGDVVVVDDELGVRITEVVGSAGER